MDGAGFDLCRHDRDSDALGLPAALVVGYVTGDVHDLWRQAVGAQQGDAPLLLDLACVRAEGVLERELLEAGSQRLNHDSFAS